MDSSELQQVLAELRKFGTEATSTEVKESRSALPKSSKESISAFCNTPGGGILLLGVGETTGFPVVGVNDAKKIQHDLASLCRDELSPPLTPQISIGELEGKKVVVAEFPELPRQEKPAYCKSLGMQKGAFIRVGDGDRALTPEEVQRVVADRGQPVFDQEILEAASVDDLDRGLVRSYISRLRDSNARLFADESEETILRMTKVVGRGRTGALHPTVAGLLAMGRYPQEHFPQLNLTFVHYPTVSGEGRDGVRFLDNVSVNGPIPLLQTDALGAITRNMSRRALVTGGGRRDMWEYPPEALREAVVNALVHRDLSPGSRGQQVQVEMYPDRLILRNPGGLFGSIDANLLGEEGVSSARNSLLMKILEDVPTPGESRTVCENRGSGIRAMRSALRAAGMGVPEFRNRVTSFQVVLPNHTLLDSETVEWLSAIGRQGLRDTQCIALALMRNGETFDNSRYRAATGLGDSRAATVELQELVARELIEQHGYRYGARYTLSDYARGVSDGDPRPRTRPNRRQQIVDILDVRGELSKNEISEGLGIKPKTVEYWLRQLKNDGRIIQTSPRGSKNTRYRLSPSDQFDGLFPVTSPDEDM